MVTAPTVVDPRDWNYEYNDREEMIFKQNALNEYRYNFSVQLAAMCDELNIEFQFVAESRIDITNKSGQVATALQQVNTAKNSVDQSKIHIDQQKQAIDTTAGQVSDHAQEVADNRQLVADDKQAAADSASAASSSAGAALTAKQQAEALYGDLDAVNTAKTQSQQAAQTAGEQAGLADTARAEAVEAKNQTEGFLGDHVAAANPHEQYELKSLLKSAAYRDVVGGDGAVMVEGYNGFGGQTTDTTNINEMQGTQLRRQRSDDPNAFLGTSGHLLHWERIAGGISAQLIVTDSGELGFRIRGASGIWEVPITVWHNENLDPGDASRLDKGAIPAARIVSTALRTSSATGVMLQAAAMRNHVLSGDHDDRYLQKSGGALTDDLELTEGAWLWFKGGDNDDIRLNLNSLNDLDVYNQTKGDLATVRAKFKGDGSGLTGTAPLRAQGTTKSDVGLPDVVNIDVTAHGLAVSNRAIEDFNSVPAVNSFFCGVGGAATNAGPFGYAPLINIVRGSSDVRAQIGANKTNLGFRGHTSGSWGDWNTVWHTGNFDPADVGVTTGSNSYGRYYLYPDGRLVMQCGVKTFAQDPSAFRYLLANVTLPYTPLSSAEHYVTLNASSDASDYSNGATPFNIGRTLAKPARQSSGTVVAVRTASIDGSNYASGATANMRVLIESRWK